MPSKKYKGIPLIFITALRECNTLGKASNCLSIIDKDRETTKVNAPLQHTPATIKTPRILNTASNIYFNFDARAVPCYTRPIGRFTHISRRIGYCWM